MSRRLANSITVVLVLITMTVAAMAGCAGEDKSARPTAITTSQTASSAPLLAVVTRAEWCSVCKANGARAGELLMSVVKEGQLELVVNDITSDETSAKSAAILNEKGIIDAIGSAAGPGIIVFVDPRSRKAVGQITVAHANEEIKTVMGLARDRAAKSL